MKDVGEKLAVLDNGDSRAGDYRRNTQTGRNHEVRKKDAEELI